MISEDRHLEVSARSTRNGDCSRSSIAKHVWLYATGGGRPFWNERLAASATSPRSPSASRIARYLATVSTSSTALYCTSELRFESTDLTTGISAVMSDASSVSSVAGSGARSGALACRKRMALSAACARSGDRRTPQHVSRTLELLWKTLARQ